MNFAVFDDQTLICEEIEKTLLRLIRANDKIYIFSKVDESSLIGTEFDVVFMDIELGNKSGIEVVKKLKENNPLVKTIFISSYTKYAQDIFEVDPVYFLSKPINEEKLEIALRKAIKQLDAKRKDYISISNKDARVKIFSNDVLYIESKGRQIRIHCENESLETYEKLDNMQEKLPEFFCRSHKSYLVNLKKVKLIEKSYFMLLNGAKVPISQSKYKGAKDKFLKVIGDN